MKTPPDDDGRILWSLTLGFVLAVAFLRFMAPERVEMGRARVGVGTVQAP